MENFHHQVATTRRSVSPLPPPPSPPLSPDSAAAEALANARWTPTKEQISVLEGLYREGMRNPTAEQIQHLTVRLREHGPIEGKNIFYWFQNHKARQRQRQKQQTFDYFARQFHRPQPLPMLHRAPTHPFPRAGAAAAPPPPSPMIVQALQAQPQHRAGNRDQAMYMQQQREVYMASGKAAVQAAYYSQIRAQQTPIYYQYLTNAAGVVQEPIPVYSPPATGGYKAPAADARSVQPKTLTLFPLNPTFAHREKKPRGRPRTASSAMPSTSASASASASAASFSLEPGTSGSGSLSGEASVPFFDFFTLSSGGL